MTHIAYDLVVNLRWLVFDYVDPQLGLTRRQRRAVRWHALELSHHPRHRKHRPSYWLVIPLALAPTLLVFGIPALYRWLVNGQPSIGVSFLLIVLGFMSAMAVFALFHSKFSKPYIRLALRDFGHDVCINCGYSLQGLNDDAQPCPECGKDRDRSPLNTHH